MASTFYSYVWVKIGPRFLYPSPVSIYRYLLPPYKLFGASLSFPFAWDDRCPPASLGYRQRTRVRGQLTGFLWSVRNSGFVLWRHKRDILTSWERVKEHRHESPLDMRDITKIKQTKQQPNFHLYSGSWRRDCLNMSPMLCLWALSGSLAFFHKVILLLLQSL